MPSFRPSFPGTRGPLSAKIMIIGEAYGSEEELKQEPLVGASGRELRQQLKEAGIDMDACFLTNVINQRPIGNEFTRFLVPTKAAKNIDLPDLHGLYPSRELVAGIAEMWRAVEEINPRLIIALGNVPLWALTQGNSGSIGNTIVNGESYKVPTRIDRWRGSMLRTANGIPLLPIYYPAYILRDWSSRPRNIADLRRRTRQLDNWDEPTTNYIFPTEYTDAEFDRLMASLVDLKLRLDRAIEPLFVSADIETRNRLIECIGLGWSEREAICVPLYDAVTEDKNCWPYDQELHLVSLLRAILHHENAIVVGQNFSYDIQYLLYYMQIKPRWRHDTMLAQHVMYPGTTLGLDYLSSVYCEHHVYWKDDGKEATRTDDMARRWEYNCRDCAKTFEVIKLQLGEIKRLGLEWQYTIQMLRMRALVGATPRPNAAMMLRGVKIDTQRRAEELGVHIEAIDNIESKIQAIVPPNLVPAAGKKAAAWYDSPKQQCEFFYSILGLKPILGRKTGNPTVDDEALGKIETRYPELLPLTQRIAQYRSMGVFGNFLQMKLDPDQRVRCNYSPTTETFRYRSSKNAFGRGTNLQNIPSGNEED